MKNTLMAAAILTFLLATARMSAAQEAASSEPASKAEAPIAAPAPKAEPKPEAKAEAPAKTEPAAEAPVAKPAPKAAPKPEVKAEAPAKTEPAAEAPVAKPAPKPETAKKPTKELNASAKIFLPLADNYKKAYDELQLWIMNIDAQTAAVSAQISRIQDDIQKNEAAITKLKIQGGGESSEEGRALAKDNKQLWADLSAARKERSALTKGFAKEAIQRAKGYQMEIIEKLEDIKAQAK
jgi:hypothetical protein